MMRQCWKGIVISNKTFNISYYKYMIYYLDLSSVLRFRSFEVDFGSLAKPHQAYQQVADVTDKIHPNFL